MDEYPKQCDFAELVLLALNGEISDEQITRLNDILRDNPAMIRSYLELLDMYAEMSPSGSIEISDYTPELTLDDLQALADDAKTAPTVEIPKHQPERQFENLEPVKVTHNVSKLSIYTLAYTAAAMILLVLFIKFAPSKSGYDVATLSDCINVKWTDPETAVEKGQRLHTGRDAYLLRSGLVEVDFDSNVKAVIEGPAGFTILTDDRISMEYGKVYVSVPKTAIGFSIYTPSAKIVDLGTEFGVQADVNGDTNLQVHKGKVTLLAGEDESQSSMDVTGGGAKKVSFGSRKISDVPFESENYVRDIDSEKHFVWKGENKLDLADVINGGNGLGTGMAGVCIDPSTGGIGSYESLPKENYDRTESYVRFVKDIAGVDCVIVPSQQGGVLPLTTTGLSVSDFGALSGNSRWLIQTRTHNTDYPFVLNGVTYGVKNRPGFSMHANCGITFDLSRIVENVPGVNIASLKTLCGLSDSRLKGNIDPDMTAELYIYLDGVQVYHHEFCHVENNTVPVEIGMGDNEPRFMTLLVTCGGDDNNLDWFIFGEPVLTLEI